MKTDELRRGGDINRRQRDVWLARGGGEMEHLTDTERTVKDLERRRETVGAPLVQH